MMVKATINSTKVRPPCFLRRISPALLDAHRNRRRQHGDRLLRRVLQRGFCNAHSSGSFTDGCERELQQRTGAVHAARPGYTVYLDAGIACVVANVETGRPDLAILRK